MPNNNNQGQTKVRVEQIRGFEDLSYFIKTSGNTESNSAENLFSNTISASTISASTISASTFYGDASGLFNLPSYVNSGSSISGSSVLVKSVFYELNNNISTSSNNFSDLMNGDIETNNGFLIINFSSSLIPNKNNVEVTFQFLLNNSVFGSCGFNASKMNKLDNCSFIKKISINSGVNNIKIKWKVDNSYISINPNDSESHQYCNLLLIETEN